MTLLVDTSVWSLAFRRDAPPDVPEVNMLARALSGKEDVVSAGVIIVELLRGFLPAHVHHDADRERYELVHIVETKEVVDEVVRLRTTEEHRTLIERLDAVPLLEPSREDYIAAAELINECRRSGVQLGTIDAIIARLAIAYDVTLLTTDRDFTYAAQCIPLRVWDEGHAHMN